MSDLRHFERLLHSAFLKFMSGLNVKSDTTKNSGCGTDLVFTPDICNFVD